jgi:hypothetical protein
MAYDKDALKAGVEKAKENIKIFREAIAKEMQTIADYEYMIQEIEANEKRKN